ncbi:hypothetical protein RIF29_00047 [Crotalaria pallida]|uniref:Cation/H+ exchanger domain-containing protein n=1 Tax=Crotalaria pallida TaxID=3830 RepID=A0AAN9IVB3_CROPI
MSAGLDIDKYMLAEGLALSGIVSILFTGIHYSYSNLSQSSQRFVSAYFELISSLAETFVFIYMGFDIAMEQHSWSHVGFIFFSIGFEGLNVKSFSQNLWENVEKSATTIWATRILVLLIGGSTGTMLEALEVVGGDNHNDSPFSSGGTITLRFDTVAIILQLFSNA